MRISDWSSDVCSSDLLASMENSASRTRSAVGRVASPESGTRGRPRHLPLMILTSGSCLQCRAQADHLFARDFPDLALGQVGQFERAIGNPDEARNLQPHELQHRSEEHTSELQSLMRSSSDVFCLKKKKKKKHTRTNNHTKQSTTNSTN